MQFFFLFGKYLRYSLEKLNLIPNQFENAETLHLSNPETLKANP